jgi:hypothetical protein
MDIMRRFSPGEDVPENGYYMLVGTPPTRYVIKNGIRNAIHSNPGERHYLKVGEKFPPPDPGWGEDAQWIFMGEW